MSSVQPNPKTYTEPTLADGILTQKNTKSILQPLYDKNILLSQHSSESCPRLSTVKIFRTQLKIFRTSAPDAQKMHHFPPVTHTSLMSLNKISHLLPPYLLRVTVQDAAMSLNYKVLVRVLRFIPFLTFHMFKSTTAGRRYALYPVKKNGKSPRPPMHLEK